MGRRPCCEKVGLNRGGWSSLEDEILSNYIKANGEGKWRDLPKNAGLKRCGKSCRLRWLNYLNPKIIRGNITQEEEDLIVKLHKHVGNRWSIIAGKMPGRTDNEIKNYWNTILCRKVDGLQVVSKKKPWKKRNEKNSGSDSVPTRRATVLPTPILNANSVAVALAEKNVTELPAPLFKNADAEPMQNLFDAEATHSLVYEECDSQEQNMLDPMGDIMQSIGKIEASQCHIFAECYPPLELVFSQKNSTELLNGTMQNMANMGVTRESSTEFRGNIMQQGDAYCTEQSGSSQGDSIEVMDEIMQQISNIETLQIYLNGYCYPQSQPASSQGDSTTFTSGIMQNIINTETPQSDVYGKCYKELMSDAGTSEICVQELDKYVICTFQDILSEITFL